MAVGSKRPLECLQWCQSHFNYIVDAFGMLFAALVDASRKRLELHFESSGGPQGAFGGSQGQICELLSHVGSIFNPFWMSKTKGNMIVDGVA